MADKPTQEHDRPTHGQVSTMHECVDHLKVAIRLLTWPAEKFVDIPGDLHPVDHGWVLLKHVAEQLQDLVS